jgi:hypothetical protein
MLLRHRHSGPWLSEATTRAFEQSVEREAVGYMEQAALTAAVESVLGAGNPAVPFVVEGLQLVIAADTPAAERFVRDHPRATWLVVGAVALTALLWGFGSE